MHVAAAALLCRLAELGGRAQEALGHWSGNRPRQLRGICCQALARADRQLLQGQRHRAGPRSRNSAVVLPFLPSQSYKRAGLRSLR